MATPNEIANKKKAGAPSKGASPKAPEKAIKGTPGRGEGGVRVATAEFTAGAAKAEQVPTPAHFENAPEIAFAGRSNVGKSSLLNMMLSRRGLARTSNTPGCTRQINFFDVGIAASKEPASAEAEGVAQPRPERVVFVDLPGYGYAKVSKAESRDWKQLLEGYLHERPTLKAVVILVDVRRGLEQEEEDLIEFLEQRPDMAIFVAATKLDKIPLNQQKPALAKVVKGRNLKIVATSAETGVGREALWSRILDACRVT